MKKGRIIISKEFISDIASNEKALSVLFQVFIPLYIDHGIDNVIYSGICKQFREIKDSDAAPLYEGVFTKIDDTYTIKFYEKQ